MLPLPPSELTNTQLATRLESLASIHEDAAANVLVTPAADPRAETVTILLRYIESRYVAELREAAIRLRRVS